MVPWTSRFQPRSLRARFAIAFGLLLALATLNIGAFYWGAQQRNREFHALRGAITRHSALTEIRADLENHHNRVKMVSDLLGAEQVDFGREDYNRIIASIKGLRDRLGSLTQLEELQPSENSHEALDRLSSRVRQLTESWATFYSKQLLDPATALAEVVMRAEPLAQELLAQDIPQAIEIEQQHVQRASDAFVRTDRLSSRLIWAILIASGLLSIALAYSLSRQLLRAIASLKAGAERFGAGELAHRVSVDKVDELSEVGESLNTMALRLRYAREELEVRNIELANLAFKDALTQLANRAVFRERVEHALATPGREPQEVAVLFIDLDNFKAVNDTFGHGCGDLLLVDVATRLLSATRGIDTVARLGGDEFAILLDHVQVGKQATLVAERVIAALSTPFSVEGKIVHVQPSIGVAWGLDGEGADELLRNADVAVYRAKARGKGRYEVFAPEMHAALLERAQLEAELRSAVAKEELTIAYQPILDLSNEQVVGFEALARWQHAIRGPVSPATFIPLAEDTGIILPLGQWMLKQACLEAASWGNSLGREPLTLSVNVSSRQLEHPSFLGDVVRALEESQLPPRCLVLEITETAIMRESAVMLLRLNHLKELGVQLAIDDFGTGYSSLAYLRRFPVDIIKIDKAFVDGIGKGVGDTALVQAIITLSQALGLRTVAEGIELGKQHSVLRDLGCNHGQGYLFARPLAPADARKMIGPRGSLATAAA
ncbi:MAG: putative bifunctional diguanylate cyclase/phosphodiesterase [Gemmatimonadaceae bacterium]